MADVQSLLTIFGLVFSVLLATVGFFIKSLIGRLEQGNKTLISLDKKFAVFENQLNNNSQKIVSLENELKEMKSCSLRAMK